MTLPESFSTCERAIRMAYRDAGLVQEGQLPTGEQYADALLRLNDLIGYWQTRGLRLWTVVDLSIPLVAGKDSYILSPSGDVSMARPMRALQGYFKSSDGIRRPLIILSWDEWVRLSQVEQTGAVNSVFVDKQATYFKINTWLIPDAVAATGTIHLLVQQQAAQPSMLTQSTGLPVEWYLAVRWGLANELATGQPASIVQTCRMNAQEYFNALNDWDVEDTSVFWSPDIRN